MKLAKERETRLETAQIAAAWAIIAAGCLIRLHLYLKESSLWVDEAFLAAAVIERSWLTILHFPLPYNQTAPPAFLLLAKLSSSLFGYGEYALRLPSLLSGLLLTAGSYPLMRAAKVTGWAAVCGVALVSFCPFLVYHSAEFKQYSFEAFYAAALLTAMARQFEARSVSGLSPVLAALVVLSPFMSFSSVFLCMPYLGTAVLTEALFERRLRHSTVALATGYALSFAVVYFVFIKAVDMSFLRIYWQEHFLTLAGPVAFVKDVWREFADVIGSFYRSNGVYFWHAFALAFLVGLAAVFRSCPRLGMLLAGVFFLLAVMSAAGRYPVYNRLVLFLIAPMALAVGAGAGWAFSRLPGREYVAPALALGLAVFLGTATIRAASANEWYVHKEDMRRVMEQARENCRGRALYLYNMSEPAFYYYARTEGGVEFSRMVVLDRDWFPDIESVADRVDPVDCGCLVISHSNKDYEAIRRSLEGRGLVSRRLEFVNAQLLVLAPGK